MQTLTKTKTVQLHTQAVDVTEADRRHGAKPYQIAPEGMPSGLYLPKRGSFLCSRKYCAFWVRCVEEYGVRWGTAPHVQHGSYLGAGEFSTPAAWREKSSPRKPILAAAQRSPLRLSDLRMAAERCRFAARGWRSLHCRRSRKGQTLAMSNTGPLR